MASLKYPIGSFIKIFGEYYKIFTNDNDKSYRIIGMDKGVISGVSFDSWGRKPTLITDESLIIELENKLGEEFMFLVEDSFKNIINKKGNK